MWGLAEGGEGYFFSGYQNRDDPSVCAALVEILEVQRVVEYLIHILVFELFFTGLELYNKDPFAEKNHHINSFA